MKNMKDYKDIDEYLANFSGETRQKLDTIRRIVKEVAPEATEKISYGIPTFAYAGKNLVHFAGYDSHIGFYPGSVPIKEFEKDLTGYKTSKGTIQFPIDKPLPEELIIKITQLCVERNLAKKK